MEDFLENLGFAIRYIIVGVLIIPWVVFTILILFVLDILAICETGEPLVFEYIEDCISQLKE